MNIAKHFAAAALLAAIAAPAQLHAADNPLVGFWAGHVSEPGSTDTKVRDLRVKSVAADGSFAVSWTTAGGTGSIAQAKTTSAGIEVSFANGSTALLQPSTQDTMVGTMSSKGRQPYQITFVKQSSDWQAQGKSDGCSYDYVNQLGQPLGKQHIDEGSKMYMHGTYKVFRCRSGGLVPDLD